MKTLLDVAPYRITPPISGGTLAIHHANVAVSRDWSVHLISQGVRRNEVRKAYLIPFTEPPTYHHTPSYCESCVFSLPAVLVGYYLGQRSGGSLLSANWTLRWTRPRVFFESAERADILQVEHPWQVPVLAKWNRGRLPLVMVAHNVETSVVEQLGKSRREIAATRRREIDAARVSDAVIVFTEEDRRQLIETTGVESDRVHVIPLGVDIERLRPAAPDAKARAKAALGLRGKQVALFAGALYDPNIQAVKALFEIAERMARRDLVFVVIGRVGELFRSNDRIRVIGQVDDVVPYFAAADIGVNPMLSGGGMQVKLLEFLAAGLPTVTTPVGVRGLGAESGKEVVVAKIDEFPAAIENLLKGAESMAAAGRELVESHYSWAAIGKRRVALYERMVATDGRAGAHEQS